MAKAKKITQNINKDAGLLDMPRVRVQRSTWETRHSNYITSNIGDIVPIYVDEILPDEKRRITMGMLSHMNTPIAPIFNAQYTEFRSFFVPYRLCADLLAGYKTRKSPWVKVFGEDNASTSAEIIVPLASQKLPSISSNLGVDFATNVSSRGGIADALDYDMNDEMNFEFLNFLDMAAYELIYQKAYRNENRESATESNLYKYLFDIYNRSSAVGHSYLGCDAFHTANREKDYFTGSQPMTQKGQPVSVGLLGKATVKADITENLNSITKGDVVDSQLVINGYSNSTSGGSNTPVAVGSKTEFYFNDSVDGSLSSGSLYADLTSATGVNIEQLRIMIKTQELLEKDLMYGTRYSESLNAHFGTAPLSLVLDEPLELKKVVITSQMQPIFQTSTTSSEPTILGTIGANATTQSGEFEILPETEFKEHGCLMICAVHKAQNSYDALLYKPKRIFKQSRFDFYTPELNDLGFQPVTRLEFDAANFDSGLTEPVSYNEAWAEYRFKFNKVHGMFEPNRNNALDYWTLAIASYDDIQSLYKQSVTELNRALSIPSTNQPQFFDAYGFVETNTKPMSLHSIPGMDGVI